MPLSFSSLFFAQRKLSSVQPLGLLKFSVFNGGGAGEALRAPTSVGSYQSGQYREEDYDQYQYFDVLIDPWNIGAQEISNRHHAPDPHERSDDVECHEHPEAHSADPGDYR